MANEITRFYGGSQASPVALGNWEAGTFKIQGFSAQTSNAINYNDNEAAIAAAIEAMGDVGVGGVLITATADGFTAEWQGPLANTNVTEPTIIDNSLKQKADTISLTNTQNGVADVAITPTNTVTTNAVSPVDEVQQVSLGGATTGTFDLSGNSTSATVNTLDTTGIQSACDTIWGSGNTVVADLGAGLFSVTFQGSFAGQNIGEMTVINNTTDGSPSVSTSTGGVAGVHQVNTCTFSGTADSGEMTFDGQSLAFDADASTLSLSGASASGTPASGTITTIWEDFGNHGAHMVSGNTLADVGQPQKVRVQCTDSPTEGFVNVTFGMNSANWAYNNLTPTPPTGFTLTSGATNDWLFTATSNASNVSTSADDSGTALRKALAIEVVTVQQGSSSGGSLPSALGSASGFNGSRNFGSGSGF